MSSKCSLPHRIEWKWNKYLLVPGVWKWILVPFFTSGLLPPVTNLSGTFKCLKGRRFPFYMTRCLLNLRLCNYKWTLTWIGIMLFKKERPWLTWLPAAFFLIRALAFFKSWLDHCQTYHKKKKKRRNIHIKIINVMAATFVLHFI